MKKHYGIIQSDSGLYKMATVSNRDGTWLVDSVSELPQNEYLRRLKLLNRPVQFGIACQWLREGSETPATVALGDGDGSFIPCYRGNELVIHQEALSDTLEGVVGSDAFLAAVPLAFSREQLKNFVTVYLTDFHWLVGVVINRSLKLAVKIPAGRTTPLGPHLERLKLYWEYYGKMGPFPDGLVVLGKRVPEGFDTKSVARVSVGDDSQYNETDLRAIGVALAGVTGEVTQLAGRSADASFRNMRVAVLGLSAILLALCLFAMVFPRALTAYYENRQAAFSDAYQLAIDSSKEMRTMLDESNSLAARVGRLEETFSHQTTWGKLLERLGSDTPEGLFLEKLGSQPSADNAEKISVAVSGWTGNEKTVTEFISKLQALPFLSEVRLASMARAKKRKDLSQFRIVCKLSLPKD